MEDREGGEINTLEVGTDSKKGGLELVGFTSAIYVNTNHQSCELFTLCAALKNRDESRATD